MEPIRFEAADERGTVFLGSSLAAVLPRQCVVALVGPLGAGKTRLVQAVAQAAGIDEGIVASPTFVLVHEYAGRAPIFHFDAYRLRSADEFLALGPEEYFARQGWCFVEWGDRVIAALPQERLEIDIEPTGPTARRFIIRALGEPYQSVLAELNRHLAAPSAAAAGARHSRPSSTP